MKCSWAKFTLVAACTLFVNAQVAGPDEIRVSSHAYLPQSRYALQVESKLVDVDVSVRDGHGRVVPGLKKENFQIYDNGEAREIANLAVDSTASAATKGVTKSERASPWSVALYFDDVNLPEEARSIDLKRAIEAAERFVKEVLQPGVTVGVFTASESQSADFTADATKLTGALGKLAAHVRASSAVPCPRITPHVAHLIAHDRNPQAISAEMYSANRSGCNASRESLIQQSEEILQQANAGTRQTLESMRRVVDRLASMPGSRVLVLTSSGFLAGAPEQTAALVNQALRAGVVISSLDAKGLRGDPPPGARPEDKERTRIDTGSYQAWVNFEAEERDRGPAAMNDALAALTEETGGVFFHNSNDLTAGFHETAAPPEIIYRLSFRPEGVMPDGSFHKLRVKVVRSKSESVQARPGYYAPASTADAGEKGVSKFDKEVVASDSLEDFPVELGAENGKLSTGESTISVVAKVDISKLRFSKEGDRQKQKIRFVTALLDAQGTIVSAKEATMDLALKDATYEKLTKTGINAKLTLQVSPGSYFLREVVEDGLDGKIACSSHQVEIR